MDHLLEPTSSQEVSSPPSPFPIVGIGASAGGLEAFKELLSHVEDATGMAYVFVQHLAPTHESLLPELLSHATRIPICLVADQMVVQPDQVYVIPPNVTMTLSGGILRLVGRTPSETPHLSIDAFFSSLAEQRQSQAIGVLLSGTGSDGTLGLEAIKAAGGMTFAQQPSQARYPQMPQSALAAGCVDMALSLEGIANALVRLSRHPYLRTVNGTDLQEEGRADEALDTQAMSHLLSLLKAKTGMDFTAYKPSTLICRLQRRMALQQMEHLSPYVAYVADHPAETEALYQDFLIHVTSFFRDPPLFQALTHQVFPRLVERKGKSEALRLWVAGCSTGEEVYSLAICLLEFLSAQGITLPVQIFATDANEAMLRQARAGIYPSHALLPISAARLQRFFERREEGYQISKSIRDLCIFAPHNLLKDPPFSRIDLLSCRNLLIYLQPAFQVKVLHLCHYALASSGFLLLGTSETVGESRDLFAPVEKRKPLYERREGRTPLPLHMAVGGDGRKTDDRTGETNGMHEPMTPSLSIQKEADRQLLANHVPASVVINASMQILYVRGDTSPYLELASGAASFNVLTMARGNLKFGLRSALLSAQKQEHPVHKTGIRIEGATMTREVAVDVIPLKTSQALAERHFLVLFTDPSQAGSHPTRKTGSRDKNGRAAEVGSEAHRIRQLEQELKDTQEEMQAIIEEREASNEALQTINEELLSTNEEFQSLNEELETSKEELQSMNEEVMTVNQELQIRNEDLRVARDYADAIVETVCEPLLVLSADLRVMRANAAFYQTFRVTPSETEQRSLYELGNGQWKRPALRTLMEGVLQEQRSFQNVEVDTTFPGLGHRIMLLNARRMAEEREGSRQPRILLAMEDITLRKELEEHKEAFLGMVSHELKTPITSAKLLVQLQQGHRRKAGDEKAVAQLRLVDVQMDKLNSLVDDLLDATALETGQFRLKEAVFNVDALVHEVVEAVQITMKQHTILIEGVVHRLGYGDRARTGQVLSNLLTNASKYAHTSPTIRVVISEEQNSLSVRVQDFGPGIPMAQQADIFHHFLRLRGPGQEGISGLGLGLYIASEIVTRQGGRIGVQSQEGKGATFFFTIPYTPELRSEINREEQKQEP